MNESKLKELLANEEFAKKIFAIEEPEDVQKAFKEAGLELTMDEVKALGSALANAAEGKELSEDDLDSVAGGITPAATIGVVVGIVGIAGVITKISKSDWWKRW